MKYAKPSILLLLVLLTEEKINPFGFTEALNRQGAQVLRQVAAPLRDFPSVWAAQRTGQDAVTVVLIDRAFIARLNEARRDASTPFAGCLDPVDPPPAAQVGDAPGEDRVLEPRDIRWPLPVGILTKCIVGRIAAAGPKAIFLDFYFPDVARQIEPGGRFTRRQSAMALGQALSQDAARRDDATRKAVRDVPILIGDDPASVKSNDTSSPTKGVQCTTLANLQNESLNSSYFRSEAFSDSTDLKGPQPRLETVSVGRLGQPDTYPLAPQTVSLSGHCESQTGGEPTFLLSPAMRLFQIYEGNPKPSHSVSGPKCPNDLGEYFAPTVDVVERTGFRLYRLTNHCWSGDYSSAVMQPSWGAMVSAQAQAYLTGKPGALDCLKGQNLGGLGMAMKTLFQNVFYREKDGPLSACTYINTLYASDLFPNAATYEASKSTPIADYKKFLYGRIVMVGADLPEVNDTIDSPFGQSLPGVYDHAVAFENLVRFGPHFHNHNLDLRAVLSFVFVFSILPIAAAQAWHWLKTYSQPARYLAVIIRRLTGRYAFLTNLIFENFLKFVVLLGWMVLCVALFLLTNIPPDMASMPLVFAFVPIWEEVLRDLKFLLARFFAFVPIWEEALRDLKFLLARFGAGEDRAGEGPPSESFFEDW